MIRRLIVLGVAVLILGVLVVIAMDLPEFGSATSPSRNETMDRYIKNVREDTGSLNAVTAVVFDYRAYDTLGEATVLFTAAAAAVMATGGRHHE
jgi:multisubunit Na+/H+ antiporter MnhB subunit